MDPQEAIPLLKRQIAKVKALQDIEPFGPKYKIWENITEKILRESFDGPFVELFTNAGPHMVIDDRETAYLEALAERKQVLEELISENDSLKGTPVAISKPSIIEDYDFHPAIREVSQRLFENVHYAQAVEEAFKKVIVRVKEIMLERHGKYYDGGDSMMNHAFGCDNREPIIQFNTLGTHEERDEQKGMMFLFKGIIGIRNRKAHDNVILNDQTRAIEYLALAGLLLKLLELSEDYR